jgi:hypothetical protein
MEKTKIIVKGILWSSILYVISLAGWFVLGIVRINKGLSDSLFDPYMMAYFNLVYLFAIPCFVFFILAFIYWGKYDKKVSNFLGLIFLQMLFMPFYSKILQRRIKEAHLSRG